MKTKLLDPFFIEYNQTYDFKIFIAKVFILYFRNDDTKDVEFCTSLSLNFCHGNEKWMTILLIPTFNVIGIRAIAIYKVISDVINIQHAFDVIFTQPINHHILKMCNNPVPFKQFRDNITRLSILSSFSIFHAHKEHSWDDYPTLNVQ